MNNILLYAVTVLIWGTTWFAIKLQLPQAPAEASILYRHLLAGFFLLAWCRYKKIKLTIFSLKDHFFLALLGVSMFSAHYIFIYKAVTYIASGVIAVVFSTVSFFNILYGMLFFRIVPTLNVIAGVLLGILGIGVFFSPVFLNINLQSSVLKGIGLAALGSLIFSVGSVITKRNQAQGLDTIPCITVATLYGIFFISLYGILTGVHFTFSWDPSYVGSVFYLALFGTVIACFCYLNLIRNIGAALAGYATILYPIVALLISSFFEAYVWEITHLFGFSLVLVGNGLMLKKVRS